MKERGRSSALISLPLTELRKKKRKNQEKCAFDLVNNDSEDEDNVLDLPGPGAYLAETHVTSFKN
jgi:hypothetical protein